jgi:GNAT superfamily N-acetyltransferase
MDFTIRTAKRADCPEILDLIRELAVFERAPAEVTVSLAHFEEAGFSDRPIWWAFVACASESQAEAAEESQAAALPTIETQDPLLAKLMQESTQADEGVATEASITTSALPSEQQGIQLDEPVATTLPEPIAEALPLMADVMPCEKVIGFALYYLRYSTWKGTRMYLEDILVTERWRGKGVGTALMDALIAAAKAEGLHGISWQVLEWNEPAIKFYERYNARFDSEWVNVAIDV